jgi:hypothetical protein
VIINLIITVDNMVTGGLNLYKTHKLNIQPDYRSWR